MKNILFIVICFFSFTLFSQVPSASVACFTGSPNCFNPNPNTDITYNATVANEPVGPTVKEYLWTATPSSALVAQVTNTSQLYIPRWTNTPNTPTRSIKVQVIWRNGSNQIVATAESIAQTVIVKHIAPIQSMTFTGAVSATPANGGTVNVSCGTQSFVATVPTPVTNPTAGVVFAWSLPSGWSGSSTSNTINITSNVGSGGIIAVSARRTDGTIVQTFNVDITRPTAGTPTIAGIPAAALCNSTWLTVTGSSNNATSFDWTATGALSGFSSANSFYVYSGSSGSSGTITLTTDNGCQTPKTVTQTISIGGPVITSATVNGVNPNPSRTTFSILLF